jgi:putative transposase
MEERKTCYATYNINYHQVEVMPDHVHLFVSAPPRMSPADLVNMFKGVSARWLRDRFPSLKKLGDALWTRTYYVGTAGTVTAETIKKYIANETNKS